MTIKSTIPGKTKEIENTLDLGIKDLGLIRVNIR